MSLTLEQIVHGILVIRPDLTREEVLRKIYEKKKTVKVRDEEAGLIVVSELWPHVPGYPKEERLTK